MKSRDLCWIGCLATIDTLARLSNGSFTGVCCYSTKPKIPVVLQMILVIVVLLQHCVYNSTYSDNVYVI